MILHNYKVSPFSEKIRAMFGYTNFEWQSSTSPAAPPRPIVDPLAGGYRKIPVAQVGADIFCDTRIISAEVANTVAQPELDAANCSEEIQQFVAQTDGPTSMALFTCGTPLHMALMMFSNFTPWEAARLGKDRANVAKTMTGERISQRKAKPMVAAFVVDLENKLSEQKFLFGDAPTIADFSAFHLIWFGGKTQGFGFISKAPKLKQWFKRISEMGHGLKTTISKSQVFAQARDSEPRDIAPELAVGEWLGKTVEIKPNDYAQDSVTGVIVGCDDFRWVIARQTADFGLLHVHFPKQGYDVSPLD
jgi:glutathione S-transferase